MRHDREVSAARNDRSPPPLLSPGQRHAVAAITVVSAIVVAALGLLVAHRDGPIGPDGPIDRFLIAHRFGYGFNGPASTIGSMNQPSRLVPLVVVLLACCAVLRSVRLAVLLLVAMAVDEGAVVVIKELVGRRAALPGYTFPSGHTATAAVIATAIVLACRRDGPAGRYLGRLGPVVGAVLAIVIVVAVATSMILIQDHYFTDTVAAVPLGVTITLLVAAIIDRWSTNHSSGATSVPHGP